MIPVQNIAKPTFNREIVLIQEAFLFSSILKEKEKQIKYKKAQNV